MKVSTEEDEVSLRELIDMKIESVVMNLGVSRSSVHFLENYNHDQWEPDISIDFHALRLLHETCQQANSFLQTQLREKSSCNIQ